MRHLIHKIVFFIVVFVSWNPSFAQTDWMRVFSGTIKAGQAMTITDEELANIVREQVVAMDKANNVCGQDSKYTKRLNKLTKGMTNADGIKLNFKVYLTKEYNAFACPDGSVRVYSALMDVLDDNELLGVNTAGLSRCVLCVLERSGTRGTGPCLTCSQCSRILVYFLLFI